MTLGTMTSIIFHVFFQYKKNDTTYEVIIDEEDISRANDNQAKPICTMTPLDWLKEPQTYQVRNSDTKKIQMAICSPSWKSQARVERFLPVFLQVLKGGGMSLQLPLSQD